MTYVIFKNNGVIDKRAITTMGVSVKSDSAIGYFGTGLKFSISCILRNNCEITINAGKDVLKFKSKLQNIRETPFDVVYMNKKELSFTTQLGRDWELWQAFRELHSNCLDEGGRTYLSDEIPNAEEGKTIIAVGGDLFVKEFENMDNIFIPKDLRPIDINDNCDVYEGSGIFYRGVKVKDDVVCLRKYNIKNKIDLTEDRTAKYDYQVLIAIKSAIAQSGDRLYIEKAVTASYSECVEGQVDLSSFSGKPSETYMSVVSYLIKNRLFDLNNDAKELYEKHAPKILPETVKINDFERSQLSKALDLCDKLGFPAKKYPIDIYETLGNNVLALAHTNKNGKNIMLSKEIFSKGITTLTRGLIEEYIHLQYGYEDYSQQMQNFIFDKMTHFGLQSIEEAE